MHKQLQVRLSFPSDFGCLFILSDCLNAILEYKPITRAQEDQALLDVFGPSSSSPGNKQSILIIKIIIIIIHPQVLGTNKQIILRESET